MAGSDDDDDDDDAQPSGTTGQQQPVTVTTTSYVTLNHNKPSPYKGGKPQDWIDHYDVIALANGWSATKKLENIPPLFQENKKAKDWYNLAFQNRPPSNYDDFKKKFLEELAPANYEYYKFQQMNDRQQSMTEPCVDYYLAKMNLINDHDDAMEEAMKINVVVNGLREEVRKRVFGKAKTIDELFQLLRNEDFLRKSEIVNPVFAVYPNNPPPPYQNYYNRGYNRGLYRPNIPRYYPPTNPYYNNMNAYRGSNRMRPVYQQRPNYSPRNNYYSRNNYIPRYDPPMSYEMRGDQQRMPPPRSDMTCYVCRRPGHIARNCQNNYRQNNQLNNVQINNQSSAPNAPKNE